MYMYMSVLIIAAEGHALCRDMHYAASHNKCTVHYVYVFVFVSMRVHACVCMCARVCHITSLNDVGMEVPKSIETTKHLLSPGDDGMQQ